LRFLLRQEVTNLTGPVRRPTVEVARRASYHVGGSTTMETSVKSIIDKLGYSWCASTRPIPARAE